MSYNANEVHEYQGKPLEFFLFTADRESFAYTNAPIELTLTIDGEDIDFLPLEGLSSPQVSQTGDVEKADIQIEMPRDCDLVTSHLRKQYPSRIALRIFRRHKDDSEVRPYWSGSVKGVEVKGSTAEVTCESIVTASRRRGLQYAFHTPCNHTPYHWPCPLNRENWRVTVTVTAIDPDNPNVVTVSGVTEADGWFKGGEAEREDGESIDIIAHTGDVLTLAAPFDGLAIGESIDIFAGDDLTYTTCTVKFGAETEDGNAFGGFPVNTGKSNVFKSGVTLT